MAPVAGHPERPRGKDGRALLLRMNGGRHEELALWGLRHLGLTGDETAVLDVGCGGGANLARLMGMCPAAEVVGIDYSPVSVALSREVNAEEIEAGRCRVVEGDVSRLPFGEKTFDVVTGFETIYFWPDVVGCLREVRRVLKDKGRFLIANEDDGTSPAARQAATQIEGMSVYTESELKGICLEAGFAGVETSVDERGFLCAIATRQETA